MGRSLLAISPLSLPRSAVICSVLVAHPPLPFFAICRRRPPPSRDDVTLHFQIIRLHKQIYAWIGCNSAKFGHLYAAAPTQPNNVVSVTSILGGASDNTGSSIARRLVLKTGLNIILACNIPKNSPMLEAGAEKKLVQKLISLGYTRPKSEGLSS